MARHGIPLEALLGAFRGAQLVIWDIFMQEIFALKLAQEAQRELVSAASHVQFEYMNHLIELVTEAYTQEFESLTRGREQRRTQVVSRILTGGSAGSEELGYRLEGHHVALILRGSGVEETARCLATATNREPLLVSRSDDLSWLWLGGDKPFQKDEWERLHRSSLPAGVTVAAGESSASLDGFRLSHGQAQIADRTSWAASTPFVRYPDVALLATVLGDEIARTSFVAAFLGELVKPGRAEVTLRETLKAYFAASNNAASAAAALGVSARAVRNRLRAIEEMLGHTLVARRPELEVSLRMLDQGM